METTYKHIYFVEFVGGKHPSYLIKNNKSKTELGVIVWYPQWRQYTFVTDKDAIWSVDCLQDVIHFIGQLKAQEAENDNQTH